MNNKYDPAPPDKHAEPIKESLRKDRNQSRLDEAVEETFPASDPVSFAQPAKSDEDANANFASDEQSRDDRHD